MNGKGPSALLVFMIGPLGLLVLRRWRLLAGWTAALAAIVAVQPPPNIAMALGVALNIAAAVAVALLPSPTRTQQQTSDEAV